MTILQRSPNADAESSSPPHRIPKLKPPDVGVTRNKSDLGDRALPVSKPRRRRILTRLLCATTGSCRNNNNNHHRTRILVLLVLCWQNSLFTVFRRYSLGILQEQYSKYELLLVSELIKLVVSAAMIRTALQQSPAAAAAAAAALPQQPHHPSKQETRVSFQHRMVYIASTGRKMVVLALLYGAMNVLSLVALRHIGAGMFAVFAQGKILSTATFSTIMLQRQYTATQWRALCALSFGVLLFSQPIWGASPTSTGTSVVGLVATNTNTNTQANNNANALVGVAAVVLEVTLSGFAAIYFEKVIKMDSLPLTIWERNFQLALSSVPVYVGFILYEQGGTAGWGGGWSWTALWVACLGAAGGLLVALSIQYGDAILKTLATTGSIVLAALLDYAFLNGPLTPAMCIAGVNVIVAICNYTLDATPTTTTTMTTTAATTANTIIPNAASGAALASPPHSATPSLPKTSRLRDEEEGVALLDNKSSN